MTNSARYRQYLHARMMGIIMTPNSFSPGSNETHRQTQVRRRTRSPRSATKASLYDGSSCPSSIKSASKCHMNIAIIILISIKASLKLVIKKDSSTVSRYSFVDRMKREAKQIDYKSLDLFLFQASELEWRSQDSRNFPYHALSSTWAC
jgi:hypothetical protein